MVICCHFSGPSGSIYIRVFSPRLRVVYMATDDGTPNTNQVGIFVAKPCSSDVTRPRVKYDFQCPVGSMGLVYLPTFTTKIYKNHLNVGEYTIHGWYGYYTSLNDIQECFMHYVCIISCGINVSFDEMACRSWE